MWYCLLFAIFTIAAAQSHDGVCPEPVALDDFNRTAWTGQWYVRSQYLDDPVFKGSCPFRRDTPNGDIVMFQQWYVVDDVEYYVEGSAMKQSNADNNANYMVTLKFRGDEFIYRGSVISTDYTSYGIVYNCKYDAETNTHIDFPWILVRKPVIDGSTEIDFDEFIEESNLLDGSRFVQNDFSEEACGFSSTYDLSI